MSNYTTEVRYICESLCGLTGSVGFNSLEYKDAEHPGILYQSAPLVFDFDFPIFDENYRIPLEIKILRHYYTREICEETVGLWKLRLCDKLNIIMPYYNQLYESALMKFNPFHDVDYTREHSLQSKAAEDSESNTVESIKENSTGENSDNQTGAGTHWDKYSDTPQGGIAGIDPDVGDASYYLTNARKINDNISNNSRGTFDNKTDTTSEAQNTGTRNIANTEDYVEHVAGKMNGQSYSDLLVQFRKTMLNIDQKIIDELSDLFFGLWE